MRVPADTIRVGDIISYNGDDMILPVVLEEVRGIEQIAGGINMILADGDVTFEPETLVEVEK